VESLVTLAILVAAAVGSVGFVGNGLYTQRHGVDHRVLRWMRNGGIAAAWPLLVVRALIG